MPVLRTYLLLLPFMVAAVFVALVIMIPVTWVARDIRPVYRVARWVVGAIAWVAGIRLKTRGPDPWRAPQPCVYLCNHVSNIDPPAVFLCLPRVAILGKAVVFRIPLVGYTLKLADFIPVQRNQADSRRKALEAGIDRLKRGISLLIFPEGTRSLDGKLLPFRPGPFTMAIEAQAPVMPITLLGAREVMPKGALALRPGQVTLVFHEPIPTRGLGQQDREELMRRCREAIGSALAGSPD
jgi:1-acyl-sn-glycerol-3-phosphate acyltransferase